ncbi:MAG: hypothetical protein B6242_12795 [Anaerolineaceae bacterium 4572_78]|nr:MAG: hypothetical protein B6242_12795 [Anaerolineaceae bacterium 4572_78]
MMINLKYKKLHSIVVSLFLLITVTFIPLLVQASVNEWVITELRTDISSITTGSYLDYQHYIYAAYAPNNPDLDFTTGWFAVDLDTGSINKFTQVGILTRQGQAQWFVYSEATVQCLRGTYAWPVWGNISGKDA